MTDIWNTFCDDISKNKSALEMTFEKDVVKSFLQALGWSHYSRNLKEQKSIYKGKWRPDFFFYLNKDEGEKEIILELKKPEHKQKKVDIEQIEAYMKLTDCHFGLYFGEKLEVFYLMNKDRKNKAVSVTSIDWQTDNQAGIDLITLLEYSHYDREKLEAYCLENLEMNEKIEYWKTPQGNQDLYDAISAKFALSSVMRSRIKNIVKFQILDPALYFVASNDKTEPQESNQQNSKCDDNGKTRYCSITTLPAYLQRLKSDVIKNAIHTVGINMEISEITDIDSLNKVKDNILIYEKANNIHHNFSSALSKYIDFLQNGFSFEDFEHDAMLVKGDKKTKNIAITKTSGNNDKNKKTDRLPPFKFSLVNLKPGDKIIFDSRGWEVTVASDDTIKYKGKVYSLSGFCKAFLPDDMKYTANTYRSPKYFSYKGKTLKALRLENDKNV